MFSIHSKTILGGVAAIAMSSCDKLDTTQQLTTSPVALLLESASATKQGKLFNELVKTAHPISIKTGGQTGVDRAALDFGIKYGFPVGGFCPKGRLAEDGVIDLKYPLQETDSKLPEVRTELNAAYTDGTLIISEGEPKDGTGLTGKVATHHGKPIYYQDYQKEPDVEEFRRWMREQQIKHLNIAGPRESHDPGVVYNRAIVILEKLLLAK